MTIDAGPCPSKAHRLSQHQMCAVRAEWLTSGAMYSTVPTGEIADSCFMLMVSPKSPSLTRPASSMKMFSSLMSLRGAGY